MLEANQYQSETFLAADHANTLPEALLFPLAMFQKTKDQDSSFVS